MYLVWGVYLVTRGCTWSGGVPGLGGVPGPRGVYLVQGGVPAQVLLPEQCMLGDMGNKRAVRILLECILA